MDATEIAALRILALRALAMIALMQPNPNRFLQDQLEKPLDDAERINFAGVNERSATNMREEVKKLLCEMFDGVTVER